MEGNYGVYFGNQMSGKVQLIRQGLYYRFHCRCRITGDIVCRLKVTCGSRQEDLGIVVPMGDGFGLDTKLPVKRLGEGEMTFTLVPKHESVAGRFVPVYPEEPFSYIQMLKHAYLCRQNGQTGVVIAKN